jgi:hypothetical protein
VERPRESATANEQQQPNIQVSILNPGSGRSRPVNSPTFRQPKPPDVLDDATMPPRSYVNAMRFKGRNELGTCPIQNTVLMLVKE